MGIGVNDEISARPHEEEGQEIASGEVGLNAGPPPTFTVKPGIQTSEGVFTAVIGLILTGFAYFGWISPAQAQSTGDRVVALINDLGPLLAYVPILLHYFTSRGKLKSNSVWASASMNNPLVANDNVIGGAPVAALGLLGGGGNKIGDILGAIGGGSGVKDPKTWAGIAGVVGQLTGGKAGKIIGGITGGPGGATTGVSVADFQAFASEVQTGFQTLVDRAKTDEAIIMALWNKAFPGPSMLTYDEIRAKLGL
jgi:hypothetical protein